MNSRTRAERRILKSRRIDNYLAAGYRQHRRWVGWFGEPDGTRCYECCDIPWHPFEKVTDEVRREVEEMREIVASQNWYAMALKALR
jgi:hypothetical protein